MKLKVLVSAYACEPEKGSEGGVGWNWTKQIARFHDVWVITRANNRDPIEKALKREPIKNLHFLYYDVPKWLSFWKKKTRGLYLYYFLWQLGSYRLAKNIVKTNPFDLAHHITFGNLWLPTFISKLPLPFIWGPIGGGERIRSPFRQNYTLKAKALELIRDIILGTLKFNPLFLFNCNKASIILVRTRDTLHKIPESCRYKARIIIETGVDSNEFHANKKRIESVDVQIISVGRMIHLKGFDLAIRAFAKASRNLERIRLVLIGEGPELDRLKRIAGEENVSDIVDFTGSVPRNKVLEYLVNSSIFIFASLKEGGAWALFEAMLVGLPVICLDIAGPSEIVTDDCGIKIQPGTIDQTIEDLSLAIIKLAGNSALMSKMGRAGQDRLSSVYDWSKKGELVDKYYRQIKHNVHDQY